jgi:translation initiation factor 4A
MAGRDLIAQAQSGTGKTGAFTIGALHRVDSELKAPQVLVLCPTHELAEQTAKVAQGIGEFMSLGVCLCVGGVSTRDTVQHLRAGPQVVVGTPGRVFDMIGKRALATSRLHVLILDEADEMLSSGFRDQVYDIFQALPGEIQVGLFSATLTQETMDVSARFMRDPARILVKRDELTLEGIRQFYVAVERDSWKADVLCDLYDTLSISQSVVFANTRSRVDEIAAAMRGNNHAVGCIHGQMDASERAKIFREFLAGKTRVLVTSDLLARGIDVQQVAIVINVDLPGDPEKYIHRIGRSARFGRKGVAINLVGPRDVAKLRDLEKMYDTQIAELPADITKML